MNDTHDDIQKNLSELKSKFEKELSNLSSRIKNIEETSTDSIIEELKKEKIKQDKEKSEKNFKIETKVKNKNMKKLIIIIVIAVCCFGAYHFFLKDNKKIQKISYKISSIEIQKILSNPREYEGKEVTVSGKVTTSLSLGIKFYGINDETGTIYILTDNAVPLEGDLIKVTGIYSQFIKIGGRQYSVISEKTTEKD